MFSGKHAFSSPIAAVPLATVNPNRAPLLPTPQLSRNSVITLAVGKPNAKPPIVASPSKICRLIESKMADKRAKNQYFWCDERFTPNHKCTKKYLHMIVECPEDEGEVEEPPQRSRFIKGKRCLSFYYMLWMECMNQGCRL